MLPHIEEAALGFVGRRDALEHCIDARKCGWKGAWMCNDEAQVRVPVEDAFQVEADYLHQRADMCVMQVRDQWRDRAIR